MPGLMGLKMEFNAQDMVVMPEFVQAVLAMLTPAQRADLKVGLEARAAEWEKVNAIAPQKHPMLALKSLIAKLSL